MHPKCVYLLIRGVNGSPLLNITLQYGDETVNTYVFMGKIFLGWFPNLMAFFYYFDVTILQCFVKDNIICVSLKCTHS